MNGTQERLSEAGRHRADVPDGFLRHPAHLLALGFGIGCARRAPGTLGTVIGVAAYVAAVPLSLPAYLGLTAALFALGVYLCGVTARALGVHDHPAIVWDEIVGYLITMTAAPPGWPWLVAGFLLFRLLDIAKPWPIRWLDRNVTGGIGVMLDDAVAGIMAAALLHLVTEVA